MPPALDIYFDDEHAGHLYRLGNARLRFQYVPDWKGSPLSHALPVRPEPFEDHECRPFFAGLLPEGELRRAIARRFGVSERNPFALLGAIGGECAGAVSLMPPGSRPPSPGEREPRWLDEEALARLIDEMPSRPLLADPDEGIRLSLAGAQDKVPLLCHGDRLGVTGGSPPSTHIVKTPIVRLEDTVANEAFCLQLARALGLTVVDAEPREVAGREFLLVRRYDRITQAEAVRRLHQEDFCQALGYVPELKYEAEGGPSFADCARLLREASSAPARDLPTLVDWLAFNVLIGNHDAHSKNLSLLYEPGSARLAPFYDLISTSAYRETHRKLAMKVGGEYRPGYIRRRHLDRLASDAGLGAGQLRRRVSALVERAPSQLDVARAALPPPWQDRPVLDEIVKICGQRVERLRAALNESL